MRNYVQVGDNITITAAAAALSGDIVKIGSLVGIASTDAAIGESVVLTTTGVFDLGKVAIDVLSVGDPIYWRASDGLVTGTATANTKIGVAVSAAGNPSSSVRVRLNGTF
uniref:DUF2190 family protein n=1 Tax=Pararhizobium sp. IMCC3301 TaxID=3067904 RepID=UPI00274134E9|nr:DUF2190 family protein [Pararhizobium sp. IMCC3301]